MVFGVIFDLNIEKISLDHKEFEEIVVWENFLMRKSNKKKNILVWRQIFSIRTTKRNLVLWF